MITITMTFTDSPDKPGVDASSSIDGVDVTVTEAAACVGRGMEIMKQQLISISDKYQGDLEFRVRVLAHMTADAREEKDEGD